MPFCAFTATATARVRDDVVAQLGLRAPGRARRVVRPRRTSPTACCTRRARVDALDRAGCARGPTTTRGSSTPAAAPTPTSSPTRWPPPAFRRWRTTPGSTLRRARAAPGGVHPRRRARHVRDDRVRDGDRQVQRALRRALGRSAQPRGLLSGDRTRRARRPAAECAWFFAYGDIARSERFAEEKPRDASSAAARAQLERIKRYAYSNGCRRRELLAYFGETYPRERAALRQLPAAAGVVRRDARRAEAALVRLPRRARRTGYGVGIAHVIDVLLGAKTEKIERWYHDRLSTYGIGKDRDRRAWRHLADELIRLGLIAQDAAHHNVVSLTEPGRRALVERTPILVREAVAPAGGRRGARRRRSSRRRRSVRPRPVRGAARAAPRDRRGARRSAVRRLQRRGAARRWRASVPRTPAQLRAISGVGEKKLADFGARFLAAIAESAV